MIRCMVIDDEPWACTLLEDYVRKVPFLQLADSSNNPIEGIQKIQNREIDLVFLDIQMPELTGIQLMKIVQNKCRVILTTAYSNYALESYEYNVVDYLLKPISFERFFIAAVKAKDVILGKVQDVSNDNVLPPILPRYNLNEFIFVKTDRKTVKLDLSDILFIEGLKDYIAIHTTKEKLLVLDSLKEIEATLPTPLFVRVHKSYIVAIRAIESLERNRVFLQQGTVIHIGDTYREHFLATINAT